MRGVLVRGGRARAVVVAAAVGLVLAGLTGACGGSGGGSASGVPPASKYANVAVSPGPGVTVEALDNDFDPQVVKVRAGTQLTFKNDGGNIHDVIPVAGGGFGISANDFHPGDSQTFTLSTPGVYPYYCSIHGTKSQGMIGTIVVVK